MADSAATSTPPLKLSREERKGLRQRVGKIDARGEISYGEEEIDPYTGEVLRRGWRRTSPGDPHFIGSGGRRCTYIQPGNLPGRSW